jgi:hypothetical protein
MPNQVPDQAGKQAALGSMAGRPRTGRVAVIAHGAASTGAFVAEAFGAALAGAGFDLVTFDEPSGDVTAVAEHLAYLVDTRGALIVGGVSLGAHAAAAVAAARPQLAGALLVMPAWTGPPAAVAALSAHAAVEVAENGLDAVLDQLGDPPGWQGWLAAELRRAWSAYGQQGVVAALRAASASAGPQRGQLTEIAVPAAVVSVPADPYHRVEVAREWAGLVPTAALVELTPADLSAGPAALGCAAVDTWLAAAGQHAGPGLSLTPGHGSNR